MCAVSWTKNDTAFIDRESSKGVRLEDLKNRPKIVLPKVADWIGIQDHPILYKSTFLGKKYWNLPTQTKEEVVSFSPGAINQPLGRLLSSNDVKIFQTIFKK